MEKYRNFSEWDFVQDADFVNWVRNPNPQSDEKWNSILSDNPQMAEAISLAKEIVGTMDYGHSPQLDASEYNTLYKRIQASERSLEREYARDVPHYWLTSLKYAAAVVVMAVLSIAIYSGYFSQSGITQKVEKNMLVKESPKGSHLTTILSDGSKVKLNSGSKITYPKQFNDSIRKVELSGEAFFEVRHDSSRPFVVVARGITTTVLGTAFNVSAYSDNDQIQVAVKEGKVKVGNGGGSFKAFEHILHPQEASEVDLSKKKVAKVKLKGDGAFSWIEWRLEFDQVPLDGIFKKLERWYGVRFKVENAIDYKKTFSGSFNNEPLKVVLEALKSQKAIAGYHIAKDEIIIN